MTDSGLSTSPESLQGYVVGSVATLGVLALISVSARIRSRAVGGVKLGVDDVFIIFFALPLSVGLAVDTGLATKYGLGKHLLFVMSDLETFLKINLSTQMLWAASVPMVKMSILSFYLRIFNRSGYMFYASWAMMVYTVGWLISVVLVLGLQCRPLDAYWDLTLKANCIDTTAFYLAGSSTDFAADFIILFLPLPAFWNLQMAFFEEAFHYVDIRSWGPNLYHQSRKINRARTGCGRRGGPYLGRGADINLDSCRALLGNCLCVSSYASASHEQSQGIGGALDYHCSLSLVDAWRRRIISNPSQGSWNKRSEYERYPESRDETFDGIRVTYDIEMGPSVQGASFGKTQGAPDV